MPNNTIGCLWLCYLQTHVKGNCSSEMVLSIRYSTNKKKEAARIEYPTIRTTSFVSIVLYLQREQRAFFFTFPTILPRKLILSTMENTTEQVN